MRKLHSWSALFTCIDFAVLTFVAIAPVVCFGQSSATQISSSPFAHHELAVYQAFLADYRRGRSETLNVADLTDILQPDEGDYASCMKGFPKSAPINVVHRLPPEFAVQNHLRIVDPKAHKIDDPERCHAEGSVR